GGAACSQAKAWARRDTVLKDIVLQHSAVPSPPFSGWENRAACVAPTREHRHLTAMADLPRLSNAQWPSGAYRRAELPERVLQFGTGMLLRAAGAAAVDAANAAGAFGGRIAVVQSTPNGQAAALNAQDGLFTLVERGLERGAPVERTRLVGSISRALVADAQWEAVRDIVARPELRVIVSNVTEAGFRLDAGFPARLTDLLHTRFARLPDGPELFVVPTELVDDNGPRLAAMVDQLARERERTPEFRDWLGRRVRF